MVTGMVTFVCPAWYAEVTTTLDTELMYHVQNLIVSDMTMAAAPVLMSPQDLAGSERAVSDAERRGEGKHINQR
jgi:hypothetical protein